MFGMLWRLENGPKMAKIPLPLLGLVSTAVSPTHLFEPACDAVSSGVHLPHHHHAIHSRLELVSLRWLTSAGGKIFGAWLLSVNGRF